MSARPARHPDPGSELQLQLSGCVVDLGTGTVRGPGENRALTDRERLLLLYLSARPSIGISRDVLLTEVWGYSDQVLTRAVDSTVRRLREKVEVDPAQPRHLLTEFGSGYRFEPVRSSPAEPAPSAPSVAKRSIVLGDRTVDLDLSVVVGPDGTTVLTTSEVKVLVALNDRRDRVVDRDDLVHLLWGRSTSQRRAIDSLLYRLRSKIEPTPDEPRFLVTVRGVGYRLQPTPAVPAPRVLTLVHVGLWRERELWDDQETGDRVARLLDDLLRTSAAAAGIRLGDGWRHAFPEPLAAIGWAIGALRDAPDGLRLRIGVHRGRPLTWVDPVTGGVGCLGPAVHRAEDLLASAPPGGILVDEALWSEVGAGTDVSGAPAGPGAVLLDLGGERRCQAAIARGDLPWVGDRFVGRAEDAEAVRSALAEGCRLVTLVGPAGVGKSRLALEVCARLAVPGGVWFASLGDVDTAEGVVGRVAPLFDLPTDERDPGVRLVETLLSRPPTVLWLDDCESALPHLAATVGRWLAEVPSLTVLATSRHTLQLRSERSIGLEPLGDDDAVALFLARAAPQTDLDAVRGLVRGLDGLPLAIELAAARTPVLSARKLLERLPDRLRLLTGHHRDGAARHRTLVAALDVTWDLLTAAERAALARSTVFRGPFTLDDAEEVLDLSDVPGAPWILDVLEVLVRHHLVRVDRDRYRLLNSVRVYAAAKLGPADVVERLHGRTFARRGAASALERVRYVGGELVVALGSDVDDLAFAVDRAIVRGDGAVAVACALALAEIRLLWGPVGAAIPIVDRVLAMETPRRAELLICSARLRHFDGHADERIVLDLRAAVDQATRDGDHHAEVAAALQLGVWHRGRGGREEASRWFERALYVARSRGSAAGESLALVRLGMVRADVDLAEAARWVEEGHVIARSIGYLRAQAVAETCLAQIASSRGLPDEARRWSEAALDSCQRAGDRRAAEVARSRLGDALGASGDLDGAAGCYERALTGIGEGRLRATCLVNLGEVRHLQGQIDVAIGLYRQAVALLVQSRRARMEAPVRVNLGAALLSAGRTAEGRAELEAAIQLAEQNGAPGVVGAALLELADDGPEALALLHRAELLVRGVDQSARIRVLCRQAELLFPVDRSSARAILAEAIEFGGGFAASTPAGAALVRARALVA